MFSRFEHSPKGCETVDVCDPLEEKIIIIRDPWEDKKQPSTSVRYYFLVFLKTQKRADTFVNDEIRPDGGVTTVVEHQDTALPLW